MDEPHPEWDALRHDEKLALIRATIEADITPQLVRDGGGVNVIDLVNGNEVLIAYQGACASCPMALCGTLGFIQQVISTKVHFSLVVMPQFLPEDPPTHSFL